MPVAFDADFGTSGDFVSDPSWTHTPVATPTYVTVEIWKDRGGSIDSVTYGGQAMTLLSQVNITLNNNAFVFELENPPSGAQTVQVNTTGNVQLSARSRSWTGSLTAATAGDVQTSTNGAQSATSTNTPAVTSAADDLVADTLAKSYEVNEAVTPGTGQTEDYEEFIPNNGNGTHAGSHKAGAASVTMSWSWVASESYAHIAVNIQQAGGAPAAHKGWYAGSGW